MHGEGLTEKYFIAVDDGYHNGANFFGFHGCLVMTKYWRAEDIVVARLPAGHIYSLTIDESNILPDSVSIIEEFAAPQRANMNMTLKSKLSAIFSK